MPLDRKLLELLVCPVTRGALEYDQENDVLISSSANLVYPVREGIPVMLETQAMDLQEWINQGKPVLQPVALDEAPPEGACETVTEQNKETGSSPDR